MNDKEQEIMLKYVLHADRCTEESIAYDLYQFVRFFRIAIHDEAKLDVRQEALEWMDKAHKSVKIKIAACQNLMDEDVEGGRHEKDWKRSFALADLAVDLDNLRMQWFFAADMSGIGKWFDKKRDVESKLCEIADHLMNSSSS